jgi:hypothetical protein
MKGDRKKVKDKLVLLFNDHSAGQILNEAEIVAITEYL